MGREGDGGGGGMFVLMHKRESGTIGEGGGGRVLMRRTICSLERREEKGDWVRGVAGGCRCGVLLCWGVLDVGWMGMSGSRD